MGTAKQLIPTFVDAQPLYWDRSYVKNMRPIRGYPDWWRIIDTEAFIDGPVTQGGQYVNDLYIWKAEVLRDDSFDLTDTIEVSNLRERLTSDSSIVNGQTVYEFQYLFSEPDFSYTHTDIVDSVSLEFDQLGRRMLAFESAGDVNFLFFDSSAGGQVVTNYGAGYNPFIVTDNYTRGSDSTASERLLFYVKDSTKQIVYRKQLDRFEVEYTLPDAPQDVVELLKVSKNIYGGLTVLYCYDDGAGGLLTGSFTARDFVDGIHIGSDGFVKEQYSEFMPKEGTILSFSIKDSVVFLSLTEDSTDLLPGNGTIPIFVLKSSILEFNEQTDSSSIFSITNGSIDNFVLLAQDPEVSTEDQEDVGSLVINTDGTISTFLLKVTKIVAPEQTDPTIELVTSAGVVDTFTLG